MCRRWQDETVPSVGSSWPACSFGRPGVFRQQQLLFVEWERLVEKAGKLVAAAGKLVATAGMLVRS